MLWYVDRGLVLTRPLPGREGDALGVAFAWLSVGDDFLDSLRALGSDVTGSQGVLELTYRAQLTPWLSLQPTCSRGSGRSTSWRW